MNKLTRFSKRQLSRQLLGGFGGSLIVIGIATLSITYTSLGRNLEQQIQQRAQSITYGLEFASEGLIEINEMLLLERIVQNYATLPAVIEVSIVNPQGILLAHSNTVKMKMIQSGYYADLNPSLAVSLKEASKKGIEINIRTVLHGKNVVVQMLPFSGTIFNQERDNHPGEIKNRGVAIAVMDLQKMEQDALQSAISSMVAMAVSALLILAFMGWRIQKLVLSPLSQINRAINEGEGEGNFSLPTLPNNELGFLGARFAAVFKQLKTYKQMEIEIVERKYIEVAQRYELATRAAKVWVWDWDIATDTFLLDRGIQDWLGYVNLEISNNFNSWAEYIDINDRPLFLEALYAHLEGKTTEFSCEHRLLKADGNLHWFLSRGQAVHDEDGKVIRAIGTITDIAERKQVEAQLQQTNQELIRATRLKDEFLANMSHELRTPLNAILGLTEGLQDQVFGQINEKQIKALKTIERSSTHLLELINDILDLAKIEAGQIELDYSLTSISHLCQSSLTFIKQQAQKKHIQLEIKVPQNLPQLLIDERRIRQVLINLLNNAVKFTPEGGVITLEVGRILQRIDINPPPLQGITKVKIYKTVLEQELGLSVPENGLELKEYIRISITDTGIGIAPEHINKLFQPFIQIDSALNRQYAGTGLGLALVKRIVELHGGQVELTSKLGLGSCFAIDLPIIACSLPSSPNLQSETLSSQTEIIEMEFSPTKPSQLKSEISPLILLVEDNEANISTVSSYLKAKGYRLVFAKDGQEGINQAKSENPNLILMDISMPGMDGFEAMKQIRLEPNLVNVPIIALTALAMKGDRDRCLEAGANDYMTKPVKLKQLAITIQELLEKVTT
jgi:PAS domain S-box-containing protein